ncbi:MAG: hypothetical protein ACLFSQ_11725 [Candidatus Zixiibacteriota bacterium]
MSYGKWLAIDLWRADPSTAKPVILIQTSYDKAMNRAIYPSLGPMVSTSY